MHEHSEIAWKIASLYSNVLGSETRDLAAQIDAAIGNERERCSNIVSLARFGEIDTDLRTIIHLIEGGLSVEKIKSL